MRRSFEKTGLVSDGPDSKSLSQLITSAAMRGVGTASIRLELDLPENLRFPADPEWLGQLVQSLVSSAASDLDDDGEICLTVWEAGEALELEVADNGPAMQTRPRFIPLAVGFLGAEMIWQNCPQGGAAVTAVVPRVAPKRSAA